MPPEELLMCAVADASFGLWVFVSFAMLGTVMSRGTRPITMLSTAFIHAARR
jgi:hypothetical protein